MAAPLGSAGQVGARCAGRSWGRSACRHAAWPPLEQSQDPAPPCPPLSRCLPPRLSGWVRYLAGRAAQREAANTAAFILAQRYAAMQLAALGAAEAGKPRDGHLQRTVTLDRCATLDWRPLFVAGAAPPPGRVGAGASGALLLPAALCCAVPCSGLHAGRRLSSAQTWFGGLLAGQSRNV